MENSSGISTPFQSRQDLIIQLNLTFLFISSLFLLARVSSRWIVQKAWKLDDSLVVLSWVFLAAYMVVGCLQTKYGAGKHFKDVSKNDLASFLLCTYVELILCNLHSWVLKSSIAFLYYRIFSKQASKTVRSIIIGALVLALISHWMIILVVAFACHPIPFAWDKRIDGHCINVNPLFFVSTICSVITDLTLILVAQPSIIKLCLSRRTKIGVLCVVNLGWLTIAACLIRTSMLARVIAVEDFTWHVPDFTIWSGIEFTTGIICATAAVIKPLIQKMWNPLLGSQGSQSSQEELIHES